MMGSGISKPEEVIIAQTASEGSNEANATVKDLAFHVSNTNIILLAILVIICLILVYGLYKVYLTCHKKMIRREINGQAAFRRSFGLGRKTRPTEEV